MGLIRVSTFKQEIVGFSLEAQNAAICQHCAHTGRLVAIYGEHATGMGRRAYDDNKDFMDAIAHAQHVEGILVVTDVSRLGRSETVADLLDSRGVQVYSLDAGRVLSLTELRRALRRARQHGERISVTTRRALKHASDRGVVLGNPTNLPDARRRGATSTKVKAEAFNEELVELLRKHDVDGQLTAREVATMLNLHGHRTGQGNHWTVDRLRRHLREARRALSSG